MDNREKIIRLWFDMWLAKKDLGIFNVFSDNAVYIESWGARVPRLQENKTLV